MAQYAVGDEAMVRPDLETGKTYYMDDNDIHDAATDDMVEMAGEIVEITSVVPVGTGCKYHVSGSRCWWVDDMLVPISVSELEESDIPIYALLGLTPGFIKQ